MLPSLKRQIFCFWSRFFLSYPIISTTNTIFQNPTAWKLSEYRVISGPYFRAFGLNTETYSVNLSIQPLYRKIRTRNNSVSGHFSRSVQLCYFSIHSKYPRAKKTHWVDPEKNASQMDGETDRWTDEKDWFYRTLYAKMEVWSCFLEIRDCYLPKLFGLIVS